MSRNSRSAVLNFRSAVRFFCDIADVFRRDQLTLYAAQASFFLLLSAIPMLLLILNVSHLLAEETTEFFVDLLRSAVPADFHAALSALLAELQNAGNIPLLSVTAVTALWSASRGMAALERGLGGVYGIDVSRGFLADTARSLLYTAALIVLLPASLLLLVFGTQLADRIMMLLPSLETIITRLMNARGLLMFFLLSLFFALEHRMILQRARRGRRLPVHLPGAMASAAGWMLFSYLYSLYIRFFPRASYLYGSLAILLIMMLWVYFCMIIFLGGAEINKALNRWLDAGERSKRMVG